MSELTATCYCGATTLRSDAPPQSVIHCHCNQCRQLSGAAFTTWVSVPKEGHTLKGQELLALYSVSANATRHFCQRCGTHLFTADSRYPEVIGVPAGVLRGDVALQPSAHYFVSHRAAWQHINDGLPQFGGESGYESLNQPQFSVPLPKVILQNAKVRLEPLAPSHLPGLAAAIEDGALWQLPVTVVPHPKDLPQFFDFAEAQFEAGLELAFATIDQASGKVVGSTRYRCFEPTHKRVEIGFTFISQSWQRSYINTEAKYLMLQHAFEDLNLNRVELLTDVLNTKSRAAIERLGAKAEGIVRSHMVMRDGRVRDSALYSIVASEWPAVKAKLAQSPSH